MNQLLFDRPNIKLSFISENYNVDPVNKTVECELTYRIKVPSAVSNFLNLAGRGTLVGDVSVGLAVCKDGDTFNAEIGKKVARTIAESKAYASAGKKISKRIAKVSEAVNLASVASTAFKYKAKTIVSHNQKYVKRITR